MSEQLVYSYPEQEHREEPDNQTGRLKEELKLYPTPNDFYQNIKGLSAMHGLSNLGIYLRWTSSGLAKQYTHQFEMADEYLIYDHQFSAGGVLGLHIASRGLPYGKARDIHGFYNEEIETFYNDKESSPVNALNLLAYLENLNEQQQEAGDSIYLEHAAELFNPDTDEDQQHFFILGYRYGVDIAQILLSNHIPKY